MKQIPIFQIEIDHYHQLFKDNWQSFRKYTQRSIQSEITFLITVVISIIIFYYAEIDLDGDEVAAGGDGGGGVGGGSGA